MGRRINLHLLLLFVAVFPQWSGASVIWTDIATPAVESKNTADPHHKARRISVDIGALTALLYSAPLASEGVAARALSGSLQIDLPMPDGSMKAFYVFESPVMEYELARRFPQIKSYKVRAVDDVGVTGRLGISPSGFRGYLHTAEGVVYIDPVRPLGNNQYYSFYKHEYAADSAAEFSCGARRGVASSPVEDLKALFVDKTLERTNNNELLTYRLAVATTGEYSNAVHPAGPTKPGVMAEVITAIDRVNEIYERDAGIRLILIGTNDDIIYLDAGTDPYSNFSPSLLLSQNQANLDDNMVLGSANYDIGHVFSTGGGGLAAFEVVCVNGGKAQGETGASNPVGDPFYIDFVAHEIGHQFGADHTFNGTTDSCASPNRNSSTAFEPGSGTTIMSYAGICGAENVASFADATFHAGSVEQIVAYSRSATGLSCAGTPAWTNTLPVANAGADYTIPARTPFILTGSASDIDAGDTLVYQWDQMDAGAATSASTYGTDLGSNALFRSFEPSTDTSFSRTFPQMANLLSGTDDPAETLPTSSRSLNFRFIVRDLDNLGFPKGGVKDDDVILTVDGNAGPFAVRQPNTVVTLDTNLPQVIEWNTACTELAPVSCANVDIQLSTDGGSSYSTLVAGTTPNDGSESVTIPLSTSSTARIKVACVGNIFFDISNVDFSLAQDGSGVALAATGTPSSCNTPTPTGGVSNGIDQEPNDVAADAVSITLPLVIDGIVNSATDIFDYYSFVAGSELYDFVLSGYGSNDLDLFLYSSSGALVTASQGITPTETISLGLANGQTYYIVVEAFDTQGLDSPYTLTISARPVAAPSDDGSVGFWFILALLAILSGRVAANRRRSIQRPLQAGDIH